MNNAGFSCFRTFVGSFQRSDPGCAATSSRLPRRHPRRDLGPACRAASAAPRARSTRGPCPQQITSQDCQVVATGPWRGRLEGRGPLAVACLGLPGGCIAGTGEAAYPLYSADQPLANSEVATLHGDVAYVDGRDVGGLATSFTLLPGCHVVGLPDKSQAGDPSRGGFWATLPPTYFAVQMRARMHYLFKVRMQATDNLGTVTIDAREVDSAGQTVRELRPVTDPAQLRRCR
jgi:hypothetical protein